MPNVLNLQSTGQAKMNCVVFDKRLQSCIAALHWQTFENDVSGTIITLEKMLTAGRLDAEGKETFMTWHSSATERHKS